MHVARGIALWYYILLVFLLFCLLARVYFNFQVFITFQVQWVLVNLSFLFVWWSETDSQTKTEIFELIFYFLFFNPTYVNIFRDGFVGELWAWNWILECKSSIENKDRGVMKWMYLKFNDSIVLNWMFTCSHIPATFICAHMYISFLRFNINIQWQSRHSRERFLSKHKGRWVRKADNIVYKTYHIC